MRSARYMARYLGEEAVDRHVEAALHRQPPAVVRLIVLISVRCDEGVDRLGGDVDCPRRGDDGDGELARLDFDVLEGVALPPATSSHRAEEARNERSERRRRFSREGSGAGWTPCADNHGSMWRLVVSRRVSFLSMQGEPRSQVSTRSTSPFFIESVEMYSERPEKVWIFHTALVMKVPCTSCFRPVGEASAMHGTQTALPSAAARVGCVVARGVWWRAAVREAHR